MARPKQAILSRNLIRDQALAIIDEEGIEALTMRRLATRLGVQAASLYAHFPNKDAVLDAVADRLATSIHAGNFHVSWQDGLRTWAMSYYDVLHWHPNASAMVVSGAAGRDSYRSISQEIHRGLLTHGWPERQATMTANTVIYVVLGAATSHFGSSVLGEGADEGSPVTTSGSIDRDSFLLGLEGLLRGLEGVHDALMRGERAGVESQTGR